MAKASPNASPSAKAHADTPPVRDRSRYIPADVRRQVWMRDGGGCTFIDASSGRRCETRYRLNLDHIVPFAKGGQSTVANLRLRCFAHNQWHAIQAFGPEVLNFTLKRGRDGED